MEIFWDFLGLVLPFHGHLYHIKSEALTYMRTKWVFEIADILFDNGTHHILHTFGEDKGWLSPSKLTSAYFTSMLKNEMKNSSKTTTSAKTFPIYKQQICICSSDTTTSNAKYNGWECDNFLRCYVVQPLRKDRETFGTFC